MLFRFLKVDYNEEIHDYDYDNAEFICALKKEDYYNYINFLFLLKKAYKDSSDFGKFWLTYDDVNGIKQNDCYDIVDIIVSVPHTSKHSDYAESVEVFLNENY